jgi:GNAT superfamily N-acetyltransferase
MERPVIPMSFEEYEVMERPFGWKVEYWDGHARLSPRAIGVRTKINLCPRNLPHQRLISPNHRLVPVSPDYREQMMAGYFETFSESIEFCGWPAAAIQDSAAKDIGNYFAGKRGEPLAASVLALAPDSQQLAGLALLIRRSEQGAYMDLLYVRPEFQRQGVATAMLNWAIDALIELGFPTLSSAYHICNEPSRLWHHRQGFADVYDGYYAQLKVRWYEMEIWRREKLGLPGLDELRRECDRWATQVEVEDLEGV